MALVVAHLSFRPTVYLSLVAAGFHQPLSHGKKELKTLYHWKMEMKSLYHWKTETLYHWKMELKTIYHGKTELKTLCHWKPKTRTNWEPQKDDIKYKLVSERQHVVKFHLWVFWCSAIHCKCRSGCRSCVRIARSAHHPWLVVAGWKRPAW